jgi:hypothetical protein
VELKASAWCLPHGKSTIPTTHWERRWSWFSDSLIGQGQVSDTGNAAALKVVDTLEGGDKAVSGATLSGHSTRLSMDSAGVAKMVVAARDLAQGVMMQRMMDMMWCIRAETGVRLT